MPDNVKRVQYFFTEVPTSQGGGQTPQALKSGGKLTGYSGFS